MDSTKSDNISTLVNKNENTIIDNFNLKIKSLQNKNKKILNNVSNDDNLYIMLNEICILTKFVKNKYEVKYIVVFRNDKKINIHYDNRIEYDSRCIDFFLILKEEKKFLIKYIYYYLYYNINTLLHYTINYDINNFKAYFENIKIPIKSIENQKYIINYIDNNIYSIKNLKNSIKYLNENNENDFDDY